MRRSSFLALMLLGCSLTSLDGFSGGTKAGPDGGGPGDSGAGEPGRDATADVTTPADAYGEAVRADRPTSWWRFEDAEGSLTLADEMGLHPGDVLPRSGKPLAIQFGVPGAVGKAAQIGNTAGFFRIGDVFDFAGTAELALEVWARNDTPAAEYEGIFNKRSDNSAGAADTGWIMFLHGPDRDLGFQFWKNGSITGGAHAPMGMGFHHIVLSATSLADGVVYVLFLDGAEVDRDPKNTTVELDTLANLSLGFGWNGALDEVAIYEHPLTAERVLAHYHAARP